MIAVDLPPGARVPYAAWGSNPYKQQLYMLGGTLSLTVGADLFELREGDCIDFDVGHPIEFANLHHETARYLVFIRAP